MSLLNDVMRDLQTRGVLGVPPLAGLQPVTGVPQQLRKRSHLVPALAALTAVSIILLWQPSGNDGWFAPFARLAGGAPEEVVPVQAVAADLASQVEPEATATGNDLRELFPIEDTGNAPPTEATAVLLEAPLVEYTDPVSAKIEEPATESVADLAMPAAAPQQAAEQAAERPIVESTVASETPAKAPAPPATKPTIFRREPGVQDVDGLISRAMQSLRNNDFASAERSLREALSIDSTNVEAWSFLYGVLTSASRPAAAEKALQQGLATADEPSPLAKLYARKLLDRGDKTTAVSVLAAHRPAPASDTEYDAFLAALLQQTGQYAQAGEIYRNLLTIDPNSGAWLIGLAMSHDSLGYREEALFAFERALASGSLKSPLDRYARRRTVELTANE